MIQATLKQDYMCAPEGHTVFSYKAGDVLTGKAAELAIKDRVVITTGPNIVKPDQKAIAIKSFGKTSGKRKR